MLKHRRSLRVYANVNKQHVATERGAWFASALRCAGEQRGLRHGEYDVLKYRSKARYQRSFIRAINRAGDVGTSIACDTRMRSDAIMAHESRCVEFITELQFTIR